MRSAEDPGFKKASRIALRDGHLRAALARSREAFIGGRARAVAQVPDFDELREEARRIKDHVLDHLDHYLARYEEAATAAGGHVHYARDAEEARTVILEICRAVGAKRITKGKSMVSEEIGLNAALVAAGMTVTETDLGEYIIQLAGERPSHIVGPALHKTREQVSDLFATHHHRARQESVAGLVAEARDVLRGEYFRADVGITGANYLIAATGTSVIITNEGNGDLTQTLARVHIVTTGIERILPNLDDLAVFLRLLTRSATGQDTETYTTLSTGPRRQGDLDGPEEYHVVLVDSGRSESPNGSGGAGGPAVRQPMPPGSSGGRGRRVLFRSPVAHDPQLRPRASDRPAAPGRSRRQPRRRLGARARGLPAHAPRRQHRHRSFTHRRHRADARAGRSRASSRARAPGLS